MAWSRGSDLMMEIIDVLKEHVPDYELRQSIYKELIVLFEEWDCDTLEECLDEDEAFAEIYEGLREDYSASLEEDDF